MRHNTDSLRTQLANAETAAHEEIIRLRGERDRAIVTLLDTRDALAQARKELNLADQRVFGMENSTFWRASRPLRRLSALLPATVRINIVRVARLAWWTISLQLHTRLRERAIRIKAKTMASPSEPVGPLPARWQPPIPLHEASRPAVMIIDDFWSNSDAVNLAKAMCVLGFDVIFTAVNDYTGTSRYRDAIANLGVRCLGPSDAPSVQAFIESHGNMISLYVLTRFDAGGQYLELIRYDWPDAKIIFNAVNLHFPGEEREARLLGDQQRMTSAANIRDREEFLVHRSDATITASAVERNLLIGAVPGAYVVELPLARVEQSPRASFAEQRNIGFTGNVDPTPNVDAEQENSINTCTKRLHEVLITLGLPCIAPS